MKKLVVITLAVFIGVATLTVFAQDASPSPTPVDTTFTELATQVARDADRAESAAEDAQNYAEHARTQGDEMINIANTSLGMFQNVTQTILAIFGIAGPILAIAAGYLGFNRLNAAQKEMIETRDRFEKELKEKQDQLLEVQKTMEASIETQRQNAANANLSLSLLALGERQYRSQDFAGSLDTYRQALELDPNSLITHYRLGYVYTQSGQLKEAEHHLNRALGIQSNFAPALAALGYVYRRIGEKMAQSIEREQTLNKAENLLLQGLKISHKLVDEDEESWWGSLGGLYRRRGQIDEAIDAYENASQVTPKSSYAYSNLALLYMQKNDREKMLKTYVRVEQLAYGEVMADVDNYWAYADLLTSRLALHKVADAEQTLQSVLEVAPKDSPYVFESLLDTLQRLEKALGAEKATHLMTFIDKIQARVDEQKSKQSAKDTATTDS
ncbi:MAG: tetratricopeptide repeat protein [Anaerolineae bacterium]